MTSTSCQVLTEFKSLLNMMNNRTTSGGNTSGYGGMGSGMGSMMGGMSGMSGYGSGGSYGRSW